MRQARKEAQETLQSVCFSGCFPEASFLGQAEERAMVGFGGKLSEDSDDTDLLIRTSQCI